jgi:type I restriction enzyme S subunit
MTMRPIGWTSSKIGDLCTLSNGRAFKPTEWSAKGLPIVRIQNLNNPLATYNHYDGEVSEKFYLSGGELLFAWSGTPGTSFGAHVWRGEAAVLNQHIFRVDFDEKFFDKRFFRYAINQTLDELIDIAHGGVGLRHVTKGKFESTTISVPPFLEQKRIADKLDATLARVDACRGRLADLPRILKRFRQSVLSSAVSGRLTEDWRAQKAARGDLKVRTCPNSLVETGTLRPDIDRNVGWQSSSVGALIQCVESGLNVKCEERPPGDGEIGLVKISAVTWGVFNEDESKTLPPNAEVSPRSKIHPGDFLISRANTIELVGSCVLVENISRKLYLSDKVLRLVMPDYLKPWMLYVLRSPFGRQQIETLASGNQISMRNLSQSSLKSIEVPLPSKDEIEEIVRRVRTLFAFVDRLDARVSAARTVAEQLTPALLAKAFRGELVQQDLNDEPASELLKRLAASRALAVDKPQGRQQVRKTDQEQLAYK